MKLIPITHSTLQQDAIKQSPFLQDICWSVIRLFGENIQFPWCGYLAYVNEQIVGSCSFKSKPVNGRIEIAYFTFPEHEGKGIATKMASTLIAMAEVADSSVCVFAQTTPEPNASNHLLQKLGFTFAKSFVHQDDGLIWEWELKK